MTKPQNAFYFRLWGQVRKARPEMDRHEFHAEHGLPESHLAFSQGDMDRFISACKAITRPADFPAQHRQVEQPATRKRWYIGMLLAALEKPEEYAEAIIMRMARNRRQRWTGAGSMTTLDTLSEDGLKKVLIGLKKSCRVRWKTKQDLLDEIREVKGNRDLLVFAGPIMEALAWDRLPPLDDLVYEHLLIVLAVIRHQASQPSADSSTEAAGEPEALPDFAEADLVESNEPF